jgi:hypothetical protein
MPPPTHREVKTGAVRDKKLKKKWRRKKINFIESLVSTDLTSEE